MTSSSSCTRDRASRVLAWPRSPSSTKSWPGKDGVLDGRDDALAVAHDAREHRLVRGECREEVGAQLLLDAPRPVPAGTQGAEGHGAGGRGWLVHAVPRGEWMRSCASLPPPIDGPRSASGAVGDREVRDRPRRGPASGEPTAGATSSPAANHARRVKRTTHRQIGVPAPNPRRPFDGLPGATTAGRAHRRPPGRGDSVDVRVRDGLRAAVGAGARPGSASGGVRVGGTVYREPPELDGATHLQLLEARLGPVDEVSPARASGPTRNGRSVSPLRDPGGQGTAGGRRCTWPAESRSVGRR